MRVAMRADLVAGLFDHFHFLGKGFHGMAGDEECARQAVFLEEPQKARNADLGREHAALDVRRAVLAAVGAEPAGDGVNIDAERAFDFFHGLSFRCL